MLDLVTALSKKTITPVMHYFNAVLPNAMKMNYQKYLHVRDKHTLDEALKPYFTKDFIPMTKIKENDYPLIKKMIEENILEPFTKVNQRQGVLTKESIMFVKDEKLKGKKQALLLKTVKAHNVIDKTELLKVCSASNASLNALLDKGLVKKVTSETYREVKSLLELKSKVITLNPEQEHAVKVIKEAFNTSETFLLHGITSSGKTEVYIELAKEVLKLKKSVLMLVPEISLTPLLTARFKAVFGDLVAVYHSKLSIGEQYDQWRKIKQGDAFIMIGARSAIFAPMKSIGLIIIDEEHSDSYIQKETPFYDAKAIAKMRAKTHHAPLLLGSATPSVDSYYQALNKDYTLLTLTQRALDAKLPKVEIVDMKKEFLRGNKSIFSKQLQEAMQKRLEKNEQTLLLINRRGHANFVICRSCGQAINCENCDITMTYHHHDESLKCHYCNHTVKVPTVCPNCQSPHIRFMGLGSEQVEAALKALFKDAIVYRMDKDTTSQKLAHEKILESFEHHGDFLVGTQMISKGLDFDRVTLVGVLSADMALHIPSFDAKEETFNLLTQVSGRSGRRDVLGEVIIQAYDATHPLLNHIKDNDYHAYIHEELNFREKAMMPPFFHVKKITITHANGNESYKKATQIKTILSKELPQTFKIIGPVKPKIHKINNLYRTHILVKYHDETPLLELLSAISQNYDYKNFGLIITDDMNLI